LTDQKKKERDSVGKAITLESQNFDIILNILIGIRKTLSDISDIGSKKLDDYQFRKKLSSEIDWVYTTSTPGQKQSVLKFKFINYAPLVFYKLRNMNGISEDSYLKSLGPNQLINSIMSNDNQTLYELCSSGQSGSLFYYTKDRRYMLKTIPEREFVKFRSVLQAYYQHMKVNKDSLINRFYGLHKVSWRGSDHQK
jgi:1-phosphatidylinositol-4-phosphate 5-kinase